MEANLPVRLWAHQNGVKIDFSRPASKGPSPRKLTRLLITGIARFIGSNLAMSALDHGYEVHGLDNFSSGKEANLALFRKRIIIIIICLDMAVLRRGCHGAPNVVISDTQLGPKMGQQLAPSINIRNLG